MSEEQADETTDPGAEGLRQEFAHNVVKSPDLPPGYQLEGPAEPGADAEVPGVMGGRASPSSPKMRTSRTINGPSILGKEFDGVRRRRALTSRRRTPRACCPVRA
ncbi:MAG TPA: hypothetical protein VIY52_32975 [Streptosporangiaceae bacterium]